MMLPKRVRDPFESPTFVLFSFLQRTFFSIKLTMIIEVLGSSWCLGPTSTVPSWELTYPIQNHFWRFTLSSLHKTLFLWGVHEDMLRIPGGSQELLAAKNVSRIPLLQNAVFSASAPQIKWDDAWQECHIKYHEPQGSYCWWFRNPAITTWDV